MIWVLVDMSFLAYRALHAVGNLEHEDMPTGVIYGFFTQLRTLALDPRIRSNKIALFCDSRTSLRQKVYPQYKGKRREERSEEEAQRIRIMRDQKNLLEGGILEEIGFPIYKQEGLESDDLIADAAKRLTGPKRRGVIITSDGDLYQCITDAVHWFDTQRNVYHTPDTFKEAKKVSPKRWGMVKCIGGCSSDNVAGVPGVGETTAIQYLRGELPKHYARHRAIESADGRSVINRNHELVVLPHYKTGRVELREPQYNPAAFFRMAKLFGLRTFLKKERKAWEAFFRGAIFTFRLKRPK